MVMAHHSALSSWKIPPDRLSIARGLVLFTLDFPSNILMVILLELPFHAWKLTMMFYFRVIFTQQIVVEIDHDVARNNCPS